MSVHINESESEPISNQYIISSTEMGNQIQNKEQFLNIIGFPIW